MPNVYVIKGSPSVVTTQVLKSLVVNVDSDVLYDVPAPPPQEGVPTGTIKAFVPCEGTWVSLSVVPSDYSDGYMWDYDVVFPPGDRGVCDVDA